MKMEDQSMSPKDDILSQTQDPLERRRLQNRLSQRNHRRKIRERIAKLQDRVIANELRAAAALNGWDQVYNPSLFPRSHSSYSETEPVFTSRGVCVSPLIPDQCTSFMPSYPPFSQSWPNDLNTFPQQAYPGDLSQFTGVSEASPICPITRAPVQLNHITSPPSSGISGETYREMISTPETLVPDSLSTAAPNQPLYYVATGITTNYPGHQHHVSPIQSDCFGSPESPASASMAVFPSPNYSYGSGHTGPNNGPAAQQSDSQSLGCLCYPQNIHPGPPAYSASKSWMGGGSYLQACPLHKMANSVTPGGAFPVRMI